MQNVTTKHSPDEPGVAAHDGPTGRRTTMDLAAALALVRAGLIAPAQVQKGPRGGDFRGRDLARFQPGALRARRGGGCRERLA
jgi:hypothetical protein